MGSAEQQREWTLREVGEAADLMEQHDSVVAAVRSGNSLEAVAEAAGLSVDTVQDWSIAASLLEPSPGQRVTQETPPPHDLWPAWGQPSRPPIVTGWRDRTTGTWHPAPPGGGAAD